MGYKVKLMTEGSNFPGIWAFSSNVVDLDAISSNDIYAILKTYGVEAARATILQEVSGVFGAYKINVDFRHLTLIADYMVSIPLFIYLVVLVNRW